MSGCASLSVKDPLAPPERPVRVSVTNGKSWERFTPRSVLLHRRGAGRQDITVATVTPLEEPASVERHAPAQVLTDLTASGFASITAQSGSDAAQRRLQAARAAKLDAYRNLAEQLYGVEFASDSVVADSRVREDHIRVRISGVIAGAEVIMLEPLGNDSYQATVRLPAAKVAVLTGR
jgi:hypothetical protein